MIKRVLLVYLSQETPGYTSVRGKPNYNIRRRPKLGIQYLVAVLQKAGIEASLLDQTIFPFSMEELAERIKSSDVDLVGFYSASTLKEKVTHYIHGLKGKIGIPIIVGGPGSLHYEYYLKAGCDLVSYGESEETILEIVDHYNGSRSKESINGVCFMKGEQCVKNEPRKPIIDLDSLPFPKRNRATINCYYYYYIVTMKKPYVTMIASRGCPMHCAFCTSHIFWGRRYRTRSVENVLQEIDLLHRDFGVKYITFLDDIFGLKPGWIEEFCRGMIERNYGIRLMVILHPFSFRNSREKTLNLLKEAGCDLLSFGMQSANPEVLKGINRHPNEPVELEKTIRLAKKKGFLTSVGCIFGLPGETKETIKQTIDYCCRVRPTYVEFYNLDLLDGSELERNYKDVNNVCALSQTELNFWCKNATRRFFLNVPHISRILWIILTKNPGWLLVAARNAKHIVRVSGV